MDILSYLIGKNSGGGGVAALQSMTGLMAIFLSGKSVLKQNTTCHRERSQVGSTLLK